MKKSLYIQSGEPATYLKKLIKLRHSIAFRLTIWYTGFFAISLLCTFAAFYFIPLHGFRDASQHLLEELQEEFRHYISTPVAILIVLSAGVGWFMSKRALSGVEEMTRAAVDITHGALDRRVPVTLNGDEIDRLANAFNTMVDRVQELIGQMKEITENIAHDLRSPITRIRGLAEMALIGENTDEGYSVVTGTIIEECDRLLAMINTMLDISEAEAGVIKFNIEPIDVVLMINDVVDLFHPVAENRHIGIEVRVPDSAYVHTDKRRLQRVLGNLLDNALKYSYPSGHILVQVKTDDNHIIIEFHDNGIGISQEDLPHIFDRFYRGEKSRTELGNGLGLSYVKAFVTSLGGSMTVASTSGEGSIFTVCLPR
jgi:signal transduction histidine kinase